MKKYVHVFCPYCRNELLIDHLYPWGKDYLMTCDGEKRGCLGVFIARVEVEITAHAKKVEGEG